MTSAESEHRIAATAEEAFSLLGTGRQVDPFSARPGGLELDEAYRVTARLRALREAAGERAIGRKIGFTNRTIWDEYDVHAPIWGHVYDTTVHELPPGGVVFDLSRLAEPRIEPEIVFGIAATPSPDMDLHELAGCLGWVAHGFELVQSVFPAWRFAAADTVAAYGLHGALFVGERRPLGASAREWVERLENFGIELRRNGVAVAEGRAENVLGGPLHALRHLVGVLAGDDVNPPLAAGEIVTTGTLTRALPVASGESWSTGLSGLALPGANLRFA